MFRTLYGGGQEATFRLEIEYGPADGAAALDSPRVGLPSAGGAPPPPPPPLLELDWSQADDGASVCGRLARAAAALAAAHAAARVRAAIELAPAPDPTPAGAGGAVICASEFEDDAAAGAAAAAGASSPPPPPRLRLRLSVSEEPPVPRGLAFARTSGSGTAAEGVVLAILGQIGTPSVRKLKLCDGLGWAAAAWGVDPRRWAALRGLSLSGCGLASLPPVVGDLARIKVLRLSNNKVAVLPPEIGRLAQLELLAADGNQLTAVPAELHHCTALRELDLSSNKIARLVFDLRSLGRLQSLQLYSNPLEYLPELTPATALRSLSLANVRILSDPSFSRFDVEVAPPGPLAGYGALVLGAAPHRLAPLFALIFRRSTVQHPLLAGALARLCEDPSNLELVAREDVALQQLVAMAISDDARVMRHACAMLGALGSVPGAAERLVRANAVRAVGGLVGSDDEAFQVAGLQVLASLARGADGRDRGGRLGAASLMDRVLALARHPAPPAAGGGAIGGSGGGPGRGRGDVSGGGGGGPDRETGAGGGAAARVRCAALDALCALAYDAAARSRLLRSAPLMQLLTELAAPPEDAAAGGGGGGGGGGGVAPGGGAPDSVSLSSGGSFSGGGGGIALGRAYARGGEDCVSAVAASVTGGATAPAGDGGASGDAAAADAGEPPAPQGAAGSAPAPAGAAAAAAAPDSAAAAAAALAAAAASAGVDPEAAKWDQRLHAIRLLAVLGRNEQVRVALGRPPIGRLGRGVRVLAMDGGGMKGMAMVELLRQIERRAGRPIWQLFDVIGGTSTGALLAVALGMLRLSLDDCNDIYTMLGRKVFNQSTVAAEDAGWRESLYKLYATGSHSVRFAVYGFKHDAAPFEELLREYCRLKPLGCVGDGLIDSAVLGGPYVFATATLASAKPASPFVFRNYELPSEAAPLAEALRACAGSSRYDVWQAVRASSAAPYYLDDFSVPDGLRFQDGATTANNPAVVALQQARLLHPDVPVDVLVSLGCGAAPPQARDRGMHSMMDTGALLVEAACSTDRTHEALATTLPLVAGIKYYRFCAEDPRCAMPLDDVSPESWRRLLAATTEYCGRPEVAGRLDELGGLLLGGAATGCGGGGGGGGGGGADGAGAAAAAAGSPRGAGGGGGGPRLGTAHGVLLVEAPRGGFQEAPTHVEAAAEAVARLPQLLRRCDLGAAMSAPPPPPPGGAGAGASAAGASAAGSPEPGGDQQQQQQQAEAQPAAHPMASPSAQQMGAAAAARAPGAAAADAAGASPPPARGAPAPAPPAPRLPAAAGSAPASPSKAGRAPKAPEGLSMSPSSSSSWLGMLFSGAGSGAPKKDDPAAAAGAAAAAAAAAAPGGAEQHTAGGPEGGDAAGGSPRPPRHAKRRHHHHSHHHHGHHPQLGEHERGQGQGRQAQAALVAAVAGALQGAGAVPGVVHLALHAAPGGGLVAGWAAAPRAVAEPGPEAAALAAAWGAATVADGGGGHDRGESGGGGGGAPPSLSGLFAGRACVERADGSALCVLGQQRVRAPGGALLTSWLLQATEPAAGALLDAAALLPLAALAPRAVFVSSAPLPAAAVTQLLRAGARAVVAARDAPLASSVAGPPGLLGAARGAAAAPPPLAAAPREDVAAFFTELYARLLAGGATVPGALAAAEAAAPALRGAFECHHL
ncbi:MAG: hypothetical protein J3K34DRAFT_520933 [Monoraphidium minutum]|nr:MAG: hypothetical protein J3K34DRAFT_520933 [Monoraphidium minutum]